MQKSKLAVFGLVVSVLVATLLPVSAAMAAAGAWTAPVNVSAQAPGDDAEYPSIAHDAAGNAIAIWVANSVVLQSSTSRDGGATWSAPVDLAAGDDLYQSAISFDASGNVIAIWQSSIAGEYVVQSSWSNDTGATWSDPERVSDLGLGTYYLGLTFDSSGNAVAIWRSDDGSVKTLLASTSTDKGATWSGPVPISTGDSSTIAADANGNVIVTLLDDNVVRASTSTNSGLTWSDPVPVSEAGEDASDWSLSCDATGRAIVIWRGDSGGSEIVHSSSSTDGGTTWSAPTEFSASTSSIEYTSLTGFDDAGRAIALWGNYDGSAYTVKSSTFGDPTLPDTGADLPFLGPVTALGGGLLVAGVFALILARRRRSA